MRVRIIPCFRFAVAVLSAVCGAAAPARAVESAECKAILEESARAYVKTGRKDAREAWIFERDKTTELARHVAKIEREALAALSPETRKQVELFSQGKGEGFEKVFERVRSGLRAVRDEHNRAGYANDFGLNRCTASYEYRDHLCEEACARKLASKAVEPSDPPSGTSGCAKPRACVFQATGGSRLDDSGDTLLPKSTESVSFSACLSGLLPQKRDWASSLVYVGEPREKGIRVCYANAATGIAKDVCHTLLLTDLARGALPSAEKIADSQIPPGPEPLTEEAYVRQIADASGLCPPSNPPRAGQGAPSVPAIATEAKKPEDRPAGGEAPSAPGDPKAAPAK